MKYIFIRESYDNKNTNKITFNRNQVIDNVYADEILINSTWFDKILKRGKTNLLYNVLYFLKIKELSNKLNKVLKKNDYVIKNEDTDNNIKYVFSLELKKNMKKKDTLKELLEEKELSKFKAPDEYENNIDRYIESYMDKNKLLPSDIKLLIFVDNINELDITRYQFYINKYKLVNFSTCVEANKDTLAKIEKINKEEGTTSHSISINNKNIREYNVNVFVRIEKGKYPKYKCKNNTLQVDTTLIEMDTYNSCYLKLQEYLKKEEVGKEVAKKLLEIYGKVTLSTVIINSIG